MEKKVVFPRKQLYYQEILLLFLCCLCVHVLFCFVVCAFFFFFKISTENERFGKKIYCSSILV